MGTKFEVEKFTGLNDFGLWKMKMKMKAVLVKEGLAAALEDAENLPETMKEEEKKDLLEKAYSSLILGLGDKVLREVIKETTAARIWTKLEALYMSKAVPNRINLKQRFFGFKMNENKSLTDGIDEFTKLIQDLESVGVVKIEDEDLAIILLNSLPKGLEHFVDTLKYGRQTLKFEEVQSAIIAKDAERKNKGGSHADAEGLIVRGRNDKKQGNNNSRVSGVASVSTTGRLSKTNLWHMRLGHISEKGLIELLKFNLAVHRTKGTLDYVHSDLWGPARTQSLEGGSNDTEKFNFEVELPDNPNEIHEMQQERIEEEGDGQRLDELEPEQEVAAQDVQDLTNYNLARDRVRRDITAPDRYGYADIVAYALEAAEEVAEANEFGVTVPNSHHLTQTTQP
ncbi:hypothetical protein EZV62_020923 [Acer yangbiense]|uniref:GAG-pre-integrase domain-containing protein n=1 Tax=Acer yangbiense TaxID=1000413 RepID=A0A5C7HFC6_9ROSI|nr:hypothetical protein EZV62_020923 [Acer yangbiense]